MARFTFLVRTQISSLKIKVMKQFRILLEDLFLAGFTPNPGEEVYENHLEVSYEAGVPYVHQSERLIGNFGSRVMGKPHLFYKNDNSQIHSKNCYVKREYLRFPRYASKYIPI